MRKQKSYNTEQSIIKEIEALKAKQAALMKDAETKESDAKRFIRSGIKEDVEQGEWLLKQSSKARKAVSLCDSKLLKFKDALAAFRTELLPGVIENKLDRQVVL